MRLLANCKDDFNVLYIKKINRMILAFQVLVTDLASYVSLLIDSHTRSEMYLIFQTCISIRYELSMADLLFIFAEKSPKCRKV